MTDQQLLSALQAEDEQGLQELMRAYGPLLRYVVTPILQDQREVEECLADIYFKVWHNSGAYVPGRGSLAAWLTTIARNTALNRRRKRRPQEEPLDENLCADDADPEQQVLRQERQRILMREVNRLSAQEQNLFFRKYYYCQPTSQIAAELGLTVRGVEGRLYRLRQKLRRRLGGELDG